MRCDLTPCVALKHLLYWGLQKSSEAPRCNTLQGRPCQLDGGIPPADGRRDTPPITFGTIDSRRRGLAIGPHVVDCWQAAFATIARSGTLEEKRSC